MNPKVYVWFLVLYLTSLKTSRRHVILHYIIFYTYGCFPSKSKIFSLKNKEKEAISEVFHFTATFSHLKWLQLVLFFCGHETKKKNHDCHHDNPGKGHEVTTLLLFFLLVLPATRNSFPSFASNFLHIIVLNYCEAFFHSKGKKCIHMHASKIHVHIK